MTFGVELDSNVISLHGIKVSFIPLWAIGSTLQIAWGVRGVRVGVENGQVVCFIWTCAIPTHELALGVVLDPSVISLRLT